MLSYLQFYGDNIDKFFAMLHVRRVIVGIFAPTMQQDIEQDGMQVQEEEAVVRTHNVEHFVFE
jgi:hypothetical protein